MGIPTYSSLTDMIKFAESLGINVNTRTKARGHQGFFLNNRIARIDLSVFLDEKRKKEVLIHEFAHFIHHKIESDVAKNHGSLEKLFNTHDVKTIEKELLEVTKFVDKNRAINKLNTHRSESLAKIKILDRKIKSKYPEFKRSYPFKPFDNPLKKTDAKYLLKYDRVKIRTPFLGRLKVYSIKTFSQDFPQFDDLMSDYILLKSHQRMLKRISSRINRLNKYYKRPSELFARFVEGIYIDINLVKELAPTASNRFFELLDDGYYFELKEFLARYLPPVSIGCENSIYKKNEKRII